MLNGFNEQTAHAVINTLCPSTLFPYARRSISELVTEGGFPPLTLQPVNFEQLYAQRLQEMAKQESAAPSVEAASVQGNGEAADKEFPTDD